MAEIAEATQSNSPNGVEQSSNPATAMPANMPQPSLTISNPETIEAIHGNPTSDQKTKANPVRASSEQPKILRYEDIKAGELRSFQDLVRDFRKAFHLAGSALCFIAAPLSRFLPEKNRIRVILEHSASGLARIAIGLISGITGGIDAFTDRKHLLGIAQIGDALTALMAPMKEITNYRGFWIGLYNALPCLEMLHGKVNYDNIKDNLQNTWQAAKMAFKELRNPLSLIDPAKKGVLGAITGMLMSVFTALYMGTGVKVFATIRDLLGILVESEKIKTNHFDEGRSKYISAGALMMAGSGANVRSKYSKNETFWSFINLAFNALGKLQYLDSLQENEPAKVSDPVDISEVFSTSFKNLFNFGTKARTSLAQAKPVVISMPEVAPEVAEKLKPKPVEPTSTPYINRRSDVRSPGRSYRSRSSGDTASRVTSSPRPHTTASQSSDRPQTQSLPTIRSTINTSETTRSTSVPQIRKERTATASGSVEKISK